MYKAGGIWWVLLWLPVFCFGQNFSGTPSSVSWRRIDSRKFTIIFPKGLDSSAQKIARDIHAFSGETLSTIGDVSGKVDIVLRNKGLISNGYVALGPFRSEFYLTPPQNPFSLGSTPWPDLLALHEYRHVQQYVNMNVGISHLMRVVFGQEGQALANAAAVPDWFFEGDAVYNETLLSGQGRGSLPYFYNGFRALWSSGKNYSWMKLRNGSYRDFVPDRYPLGFMLVAWGRERYGNQFWRDVTRDAAAYRPLFYPFQRAIKKYSGQSFHDFRDSALSFYKNRFGPEHTKKPDHAYYVNETNPVFDTSGNLIYLRNGVREIPRFMMEKDGRKHTVRKADVMVDDYFSYRNGRIVYAALRSDVRWPDKTYNEIRMINAGNGKQRWITTKTRFFSPDISRSGDSIVVVNDHVNGKVSLALVSTKTGEVLKEFQDKKISNFSYPKFYHGSIISCVSDTLGRMSIAQTDIRTGETRYLIPFSGAVAGFPLVQDDTLYFSMSRGNDDELFAYTFDDRRLWRLAGTQPSIGKYQVAAGKDLMVWSTFTAEGIQLQREKRNDIRFEEVSPVEAMGTPAGFTNIFGGGTLPGFLYHQKDTVFSVKKYHRLTRPVNFYGLSPNVSGNQMSLHLLGENILNTIQTDLSVGYKTTDPSKTAAADFVFGDWFPVFTFGYHYTLDQRFIADQRFVYYNTSEPYVGFYIPLNFSRSRYYRSLSFGSQFVLNKSLIQKQFKNRYHNTSFSYLNSSVSVSNSVRQATAQVAPRFAQTLYAGYKFPASHLRGYQYLIIGRLFLPGIAVTHSLNFTFAYSQKDTAGKINFSSSFPFSRGYEAVNLHRLEGVQINYQLPLLYPEKGIGNVVYLLRLRGNLFYDDTHAEDFLASGDRWKKNFMSAGAELFFDTRWWNQAPVSFGIRYSHLMQDDVFGGTGRNRWEFIVPLNLFGN